MKKLNLLFLATMMVAMMMFTGCHWFDKKDQPAEQTPVEGDDLSLEDDDLNLDTEIQPGSSTAGLLPGEKLNANGQPEGASNYYVFCIRYDGNEGGHDPDLHGEIGPEYRVFTNLVGGYNWWFPKNKPATGKESVGVLADGTVFVKKAYTAPFMSESGYVDIKAASKGNIPKRMQAGKVGGQDAFLIKGFFKK